MRRFGWALILLPLLASAAAAVHVPPFSTAAGLEIFGPEVARTVASALQHAGVEVAPGGSGVAGRIDLLDPDRVRLRATVAGRSAQVEGPLELIDVLAGDLGKRLAPLVPATTTGRGAGLAPLRPPATDALPSARPTDPVRRGAASAPAAIGAPSLPAPSSPPAGAPPPPAADPALAAPPPSTAPAPSIAPTLPPTTTPSAAPAPAVTLPPPVTPAAPPAAPAKPSPDVVAEPRAPADIPLTPVPEEAGGFAPYLGVPFQPPSRSRRGSRTDPGVPRMAARAVLNVIRTPEGCAAGEWATLAAREVLERRLMVQTQRGGCGVLPLGQAAGLAVRSGVPSVVMASFESLELQQRPDGLHPVGRLRVVVVRDGRAVLHRLLEVASQPLASPDPARAAYDLTARGFLHLSAEIAAALADGH